MEAVKCAHEGSTHEVHVLTASGQWGADLQLSPNQSAGQNSVLPQRQAQAERQRRVLRNSARIKFDSSERAQPTPDL